MELADYTADAICCSMGLAAFEPAGPGPTLRVLLTPAFHPEVCITATLHGDGTRLSVTALREMLWRKEFVQRLPDVTEEASSPRDNFDGAVAGFETAVTGIAGRSRTVCLDGMRAECVLVRGDDCTRFAGPVSNAAVAAFVGPLLWWSWTACQNPRVRNAVADCAWYLGRDYPRQEEPAPSAAKRLMVLGNADDRADYFAALRSRAAPPT